MKAVRLVEIGKPLELQEVPTPSVGEGEVLVKVKAAGICHSDVHYRAGVSPVGALPQTLGHEVAGVIEQVGPGARPHFQTIGRQGHTFWSVSGAPFVAEILEKAGGAMETLGANLEKIDENFPNTMRMLCMIDPVCLAEVAQKLQQGTASNPADRVRLKQFD